MSSENYKAIADRLVERGLLGKTDRATRLLTDDDDGPYECAYRLEGAQFPFMDFADVVCHDWRVAGACIEDYAKTADLYYFFAEVVNICDNDVPVPLAIILAYLESSESENKCGDFDDRPRHYP